MPASNSLGQNIAAKAAASLPFELLDGQRVALQMAADFAASAGPCDVFVLNGYAGTGKTSVVGALLGALVKSGKRVKLLAPTGRAAKVASAFSGLPASTIHRRLYRPALSDASGRSYEKAPNMLTDTLFVVDEASLISDAEDPAHSLLVALIEHVYSGRGCHLMLVGDEAQLPPVGQKHQTAMLFDRLRELGLSPSGCSLDLPVRQAAEGGIVYNATLARRFLYHGAPQDGPCLKVSGFNQIEVVSSRDLADALSDSYSQVGEEETLIVTRSNFRANEFNKAVRGMVKYCESPLERGDRLVISKNDYFWARKIKGTRLIANGDMAKVTWVGRTQKVYGRYFTEVELELSDSQIVSAQLMLRSLVCDGPSIPASEMQRWWNRILDTYHGELSERIAASQEDEFYNALQAKYAYCVTCHKAQGGQWRHVYIDMAGITEESFGSDFYRWLYTALTRATEKVYLINPPLRII